MTEYPILFSGEMVRAILSGHKSVTRRLIVNGKPDTTKGWGRVRKGDRLWVRETWALDKNHAADDYPMLHYLADGAQCHTDLVTHDVPHVTPYTWPGTWKPGIHMSRWMCRLHLEATEDALTERLQDITAEECRREGIALPVSTADCPKGKARPLIRIPNPYRCKSKYWTDDDYWRCEYACLWEAINSKRAPWSSNPWVWRIAFRRVEG